MWLAKLAEKGKITGIFFADVYGVDDTFPGQMEEQFKAGGNCAQMDPVVFVSAMAAVTKSLCFGITGSTSYINVRICPRTRGGQLDPNLISFSHSSWREPGPHWTTRQREELLGMW